MRILISLIDFGTTGVPSDLFEGVRHGFLVGFWQSYEKYPTDQRTSCHDSKRRQGMESLLLINIIIAVSGINNQKTEDHKKDHNKIINFTQF